MKIAWSGTGSAWSNRFGNSSALLETAGEHLMVDCGHTVPGRLPLTGVELRDVSSVFISHLHGDHVYGLEEWGFKNYLLWRQRPRLFLEAGLATSLWDRVLSGTMGVLDGRSRRLDDFFEPIALEVGKPAAFGPWTLEIRPVRHVPGAAAFGLRVSTGERGFGFTCDSRADADPWFYEATDTVFHDCSFGPLVDGTVHAHFEELESYPLAFREKTCLVHYDDSVEARCHDPSWMDQLLRSGMRLTTPGKWY